MKLRHCPGFSHRALWVVRVFVLVGAIVNVAVSWGCVMARTPSGGDLQLEGSYLSRVDPSIVEAQDKADAGFEEAIDPKLLEKLKKDNAEWQVAYKKLDSKMKSLQEHFDAAKLHLGMTQDEVDKAL